MATQKEFLSRLGLLAKACEFQLSQDLVALYDRALKRFGYDAATAAVEAAVIERRGNERMPSIGDLVHRCSPQILEQDTAVEVAGRVITAVTKFGWANADLALDWIGEVGRHCVAQNGGWIRLCETMREREIGTWRAQLRDQAAAAIRRHKAGVLGDAPKFGEVAGAPRMAALVGDVLKKSEVYGDNARDPRRIPLQPSTRQFDAQNNAGVPQALQSTN